MYAIFSDLLITSAFCLTTGYGLFRLITPKFLRRPYLVIATATSIGFLQLATVDGYLIGSGEDISTSLRICAVFGAFTLLAALLLNRPATLAVEMRDALRAFMSVRAGWFALLLVVVLAPVLRAGFPTTPYRIGIDQVGYGESAQYLAENGSLPRVTAVLQRSLDTSDLRKAKAQNLKALNFETYVDSEFLVKAFRWGFPGTIASLTLLTNSDHVYRVEFLIIILSYGMLLVLCYFIVREYFALGSYPAMLIAAAVGLNCNLLNVYYEGQYAQIFSQPYLVLMLLLYLQVRRMPRRLSTASFSGEFWRSVLLFSFLLAGIFFTYNEALVLIFALLYLTFLLDAVLSRTSSQPGMILIALSSIVGFALAFPISSRWIFYTFANLAGLSHAGFWQPHWGSFAEIVGLFDMYRQTGYILYGRSLSNEVMTFLVSVLLATAMGVYLLRSKHVDKSVWLAGPLLILAAYLKTKDIDGILNYPYMKLYTLLLPMVSCAVFSAVYVLLGPTRNSVLRALAPGSLVVVMLTGLGYVAQYLVQYNYVTSDMFALYDDGHRRFDNMVLETPRYQPLIKDFMLAPLLSMNWLNESDGEKFVAPDLHKPVTVLFWRSDLFCMDCVARKYSSRVIYRNDTYMVLETRSQLKDLCTKRAAEYTIRRLGYDTQETEWPGLPSPQCDYKFGQMVRETLDS